MKIDAETGDEVDSSEIIKGYEVGKGQYIEIEPEELEAIAIESNIMPSMFLVIERRIMLRGRCQSHSGAASGGLAAGLDGVAGGSTGCDDGALRCCGAALGSGLDCPDG